MSRASISGPRPCHKNAASCGPSWRSRVEGGFFRAQKSGNSAVRTYTRISAVGREYLTDAEKIHSTTINKPNRGERAAVVWRHCGSSLLVGRSSGGSWGHNQMRPPPTTSLRNVSPKANVVTKVNEKTGADVACGSLCQMTSVENATR